MRMYLIYILLNSRYYDKLLVGHNDLTFDDDPIEFTARCNRIPDGKVVDTREIILPDDAELERLTIIIEECAEVIAAVTAIKRFGFDAKNPALLISNTNREDLARELGDVTNAINMLTEARDVDAIAIIERADKKSKEIGKWLFYN